MRYRIKQAESETFVRFDFDLEKFRILYDETYQPKIYPSRLIPNLLPHWFEMLTNYSMRDDLSALFNDTHMDIFLHKFKAEELCGVRGYGSVSLPNEKTGFFLEVYMLSPKGLLKLRSLGEEFSFDWWVEIEPESTVWAGRTFRIVLVNNHPITSKYWP